jgi:hypothetical protein
MKPSATLSLTRKGRDELLNRVYKLNIRLRSMLILLANPKSLEHIQDMRRDIFSSDEVTELVHELMSGGFIAADGEPVPQATVTLPGANSQLADGIIISEAKFLLVDFCVDSFGTQSKTFVDEIGTCKNARHMSLCLNRIFSATQMQCPGRMHVLLQVIACINNTA